MNFDPQKLEGKALVRKILRKEQTFRRFLRFEAIFERNPNTTKQEFSDTISQLIFLFTAKETQFQYKDSRSKKKEIQRSTSKKKEIQRSTSG